ncbi:CHAP domain-containing protein [Massilia sp. MB5]|uniref:CHAP domain-containing protein n=1 Tax=Massilia sp. MB5 TaxID=2919578 RepID=UPI001F0F66D6|nr:CHAP domain-containing protein [Massilia sp. MB5]UMR32423.1 CHAP domain-containing protein [Massilia sp. MB5]
MRKLAVSLVTILAVGAGLFIAANHVNINPKHSVGEVLDSHRNVSVFYNGAIGHVSERNVAPDGYNLGLKYQCVEFVKRYYYERFQHRMPQDRGHAKEFYNRKLSNGTLNAERGLMQFANGAGEMPAEEDLLVFGPWLLNRFGHVAIVSQVGPDYVEVIQQNPGPFGTSRERYKLLIEDGRPRIDAPRLSGWLRMPMPADPANASKTE